MIQKLQPQSKACIIKWTRKIAPRSSTNNFYWHSL